MSRSTTSTDEYIDYSCSTPTERLSRDVETLLRKWFIIDGSDRHVSFHGNHLTNNNGNGNGNGGDVAPVTPAGKRRANARGGLAKTPPRTGTCSNKGKHMNMVHITPGRNKNTGIQLLKTPGRGRTPSSAVQNTGGDSDSASMTPSQLPLSPSLFHTPPRTRKDLYALEDARSNADIQLIRSGKIMYSTTPLNSTHHRDRVQIELELCLWDGPPVYNNNNNNGACAFGSGSGSSANGNLTDVTLSASHSDGDSSKENNPNRHNHNHNQNHIQNLNHIHKRHHNLPLSLQSNATDPFPKVNILSNLSCLLGIGQHITLSPTPTSSSTITTFLQSTMEALSHAHHPSRPRPIKLHVPVPVPVPIHISTNISNSHPVEDKVALHTAALNALSGQLQTALNVATAACDSRLPAFGIWGVYRPNLASRQRMSIMNIGTSIHGNEGESENADGNGGASAWRSSEATLSQSVMEVPSWMNGGDLFNLASESSVCCLFRKHIESLKLMEDGMLEGEDGNDSGSSGSDDDEEDDVTEEEEDDGSEESSDHDYYYYNNDESDARAGTRSAPGSPTRRNRSGKNSSTMRSPRRQGVPLNLTQHGHGHGHGHGQSSRQRQRQRQRKNELYLPAFLAGKCHSGGSFFATGAEFAIHVVPPGISYPVHCTTLNSLGQLLLQHCPSPKVKNERTKSGRLKKKRISRNDNDRERKVRGTVVVSGARHKYTWSKTFQFHEDRIPRQDDLLLASPYSQRYKAAWNEFNIITYGLPWRDSSNTKLHYGDDTISTEQYRKECQAHALKMLYRALCGARSKRSRKALVAKKALEPIWGSAEDPINLVTVDVTWAGTRSGDASGGSLNAPRPDPLLTLPLRIRSQNELSSQDVLEMENTILSTIFNPLSVASTDFRVCTIYDSNAACTTLSATNRCLLASLIRACTLDHSNLLGHLTNSSILEELHQRDELDAVAEEIMKEANISDVTRRLVEVMDWASMADMLDDDAAINQSRMQDIVEQLYVACVEDDQYPSPPEEIFDDSNCHDDEIDEPLFQSYFDKSCRPGRLLSILFTSMSGLQTPSAMAALWMAFVSDLRMRWEKRERLSNLGHVPGLDDDFGSDEGIGGIPDFLNGRKRKKQRNVTSGIGSKAKNAAFLNSSEKDPDLDDCIINQKLHVFNIGVENMIAAEMKRLKEEQASERKKNDLRSNIEDSHHGASPKATAPPQSQESTFGNGMRESRSKEDLFFDAVGALGDEDFRTSLRDTEMASNLGLRRGARCPVHGASLIGSKDQIFAPYVQRDTPLTDDLILERRRMLAKSGPDSTIQSRIEAAHRLQKPKLVNDISAFKAANPGAVFQDFITWYGNPENPLEQYEDEELDKSTFVVGSPSKTPEEEAYEALYVLSATRQFWSDCWDESKPIPAEDQQPLFDAFSTVEMLLLWFESIHPAFLMNQILAVNLAMANFVLQTSASSRSFRPVRAALLRLQEKTTEALHLLNNDAIKSISNPIKPTIIGNIIDPFAYISPQTIQVCESVCTCIGDAEIVLSRATSLLTKLNGDEDLVRTILEAPEGRNLEARSSQSRAGILGEIHTQQQRNSGKVAMNGLPDPSVREYILRNLDEQNPCQLTVSIGGTFGLEDGGTNSTKGGLVLALKKCLTT